MFRFSDKKKFVEINLASKKRSEFYLKILQIRQRIKKKETALIVTSLLIFAGIFIESYVANRLITSKQEEIQRLKQQILFKMGEIRRLKSLLAREEEKFKDFYIPTLKEKVFFIWYHTLVKPKIWKSFEEFQKIVSGTTPFAGFVAYPNPYFLKSSLGSSYKEPLKLHLIEYKKLTLNPFGGKFDDNINRNFVVVIDAFDIDPNFRKNINKVKDSTIRANLILEYGLIKMGLKGFKVHTPLTLIMPVNVVLPEGAVYREKLRELHDFCDKLIVNKEYKQEIFMNNRVEVKAVLDAVCLKNLY